MDHHWINWKLFLGKRWASGYRKRSVTYVQLFMWMIQNSRIQKCEKRANNPPTVQFRTYCTYSAALTVYGVVFGHFCSPSCWMKSSESRKPRLVLALRGILRIYLGTGGALNAPQKRAWHLCFRSNRTASTQIWFVREMTLLWYTTFLGHDESEVWLARKPPFEPTFDNTCTKSNTQAPSSPCSHSQFKKLGEADKRYWTSLL